MNKTASFTIGKVTGVHGLKGSLKIWSYAHSIDTFCPDRNVLLQSAEQPGKPYTIVKAWHHKKGVLLSLKGVDNLDLARNLVGSNILIDREQLPEPEEDTWFWQDLLGLEVFDHKKGFIGCISSFFSTGAHDIIVVTDNSNETLVPMHKNFVKSVDFTKNSVRITLPEDY